MGFSFSDDGSIQQSASSQLADNGFLGDCDIHDIAEDVHLAVSHVTSVAVSKSKPTKALVHKFLDANPLLVVGDRAMALNLVLDDDRV